MSGRHNHVGLDLVVSRGQKEIRQPNNSDSTCLPTSSMHAGMEGKCIQEPSSGISSFNALHQQPCGELMHEENSSCHRNMLLENFGSLIHPNFRMDKGWVKGQEPMENSLGYVETGIVEASAHAGGIWDLSIKGDNSSSSVVNICSQTISIKLLCDSSAWIFTTAPCERRADSSLLLEHLVSFRNMVSLPWFLLGDFNETFLPSESRGVASPGSGGSRLVGVSPRDWIEFFLIVLGIRLFLRVTLRISQNYIDHSPLLVRCGGQSGDMSVVEGLNKVREDSISFNKVVFCNIFRRKKELKREFGVFKEDLRRLRILLCIMKASNTLKDGFNLQLGGGDWSLWYDNWTSRSGVNWGMMISQHGAIGVFQKQELMAMGQGLRLVWNMGCKQITMESACLEVVQIISEDIHIRLRQIEKVVYEVRSWLSRNWLVEIKFIVREANQVADYMSKL
ncbi:hypothetical protein Lal_00033593 [Lupinus albus]|nr:hypothetical protein Lal_00033593 [Lupinus albus]